MIPAHLMQELCTQPWLIMPEAAQVLTEAVRSGNISDVSTRYGEQEKPFRAGDVAVLPMHGVLTRLGNYGGTSTEQFARWLSQAVADDSVKAILIDIDSPGGSYVGTHELADRIYAARGKKPIVAVTHSLMASGAYYAGSAADKIVASASAMVGSIGVLTMHADLSGLLNQFGVRITFITAGKHKVDGNWMEPLNPQSRATLQEGVDYVYQQFVAAAARNRGVSADKVASNFGQGKVLFAPSALQAGMIDSIGSLEQVLEDLAGQRISLTTNPLAQSTMSNTTQAAAAAAVPAPIQQATQQTAPAVPQQTAAAPAAPAIDQAALTKAGEEATAAERKRASEICALCHRAKKPEMAIAAIKEGTSVQQVQQNLLDAMLASNTPVGEESDKDPLASADPDAKFKAEYRQASDLYQRQGVTEEAFVRSRRRDAGLSVPPLKQSA